MLDPQVLADLPLLRAAAPQAIAALARHAVERSFSADETIFLAGTEPRGLGTLRRQGVIRSLGRGQIEILSREKLRRAAEL
jgi:hypothetical protein